MPIMNARKTRMKMTMNLKMFLTVLPREICSGPKLSLAVTYSAARSDQVSHSQSRQSYRHGQHHQQFGGSGLLSQAGQILIPDTQQLLLAVRMSHKLRG
ncbi:hypothetical protein F7725_006679 [Dissostichus mawsoni]|uniref:Uncharacterized protein n=1 Tax=Dissostichus mawsoni TaxID=36200 RepID=A0A7J5XW68_DISMA|nr:hypothetical protein F7725_006679 [Dissostichus mawsoni]